MSYNIITKPNEQDLIEWNDFSINHYNGNYFQSPSFFRLFEKIDNYIPFVFLLKHGDELISVLCGVTISERGIKSFFSKRTIIWGGPLLKENKDDYLKIMLNKLTTVTKNTIYTEFRNLYDLDEFKDEFANHGFHYHEHLNFQVPITTTEEQTKIISKSKLRQIRSSKKNGAYIEEAQNNAEVYQFYLILGDLYKRKIKKPLPPLGFFESFFDQNTSGKIFLVKLNKQIIGGIVCPIHSNKVIYEWYVAGIDGEIKAVYPSVLATWAPIEYALKNEIKYFDFLGAGSPSSDYGVREFKSKFGGNLVENGRFLKINNPLLYYIGKIALRLIKISRK